MLLVGSPSPKGWGSSPKLQKEDHPARCPCCNFLDEKNNSYCLNEGKSICGLMAEEN
jgi:hypothetical protein